MSKRLFFKHPDDVKVVRTGDRIFMGYKEPTTGRRFSAVMEDRCAEIPICTMWDGTTLVCSISFAQGAGKNTIYRVMRLAFNGLVSVRLKSLRYRRNRQARRGGQGPSALPTVGGEHRAPREGETWTVSGSY